MKLTNKLFTVGLGLSLPFAMVACNEAKEKVAEAKKKTEEKVASIPKSPSDLLDVFKSMNTELESVTDVESAKKSLPKLEKLGKLLHKGREAIGGEEAMNKALEAKPELAEKFKNIMGSFMKHQQRIQEKSPEAFKLINDKMESIMK